MGQEDLHYLGEAEVARTIVELGYRFPHIDHEREILKIRKLIHVCTYILVQQFEYGERKNILVLQFSKFQVFWDTE